MSAISEQAIQAAQRRENYRVPTDWWVRMREALVEKERRILAERCHPVPTAWNSSYVVVALDDELAKQTRRQKII